MEMMEDTLQARLLRRLDEQAEERAISFYDEEGRFRWYTYGEFYQRAAGYAASLASKGLATGDVCIIVLPSTEYAANLLLAVLELGAIPLLVAPPVLQGDAAYSSLQRILEGIIEKTDPAVVICPEAMAALRPQMENGKTRFFFGEGAVTPLANAAPPRVSPAAEDVAALQLTSGTTGFPRVCVWKQRNVLAALDGMAAAMKLAPEDICLNWTPLYHDMGLMNNFMLCLVHGVPLVMLEPHSFVRKPALWLRALADTGATVTWSPNFGFALAAQRVRDKQVEGVRLDGVRAFWNAAERIHYETMCTFHERFRDHGVNLDALKTNFGCAENVGGATFSDPDDTFVVEWVDRDALQKEWEAQPIEGGEAAKEKAVAIVGVGRPYPGMNIKILAEDGTVLPDGRVGAIGLDTPSRMEGYRGDPEETALALQNGLLMTGDLGYLRDGELFWTGRARERIAVRGKKLDPSDFEPVLFDIPGLRTGNFAAFGVDDSRQGTQRLVVIAEVREPLVRTRAELEGEIRSRILTQIGVSVSDVVLVKTNTLTKTSSGKRRHTFFRQLYLDGKLQEFVA